MNKPNFKIGQQIDTKVYTYSDPLRNYVKKVEGIVHQITDNLIVIQKPHYKESFQYCDFYKYNAMEFDNSPYELEYKRYTSDIIRDCIQDFYKEGEGYVFNEIQLEQVLSVVNQTKYTILEEDNIIYLKNLEFNV